jgi:hypothetical protein
MDLIGRDGVPGLTPETLADAVQADLGTMLPPILPVPQLHALDDAPLAGQIDRSGRTAGRNLVANDQFFLGAIAEVHDDAFKINRTAADPQLNGPEPAVMLPHVNIVVILSAIYVGIAEMVPAAFLCVQRGAESQDKQNTDC